MGRRWGQGVEREASAPGLLQRKGRDLETGFGEAERERRRSAVSPPGALTGVLLHVLKWYVVMLVRSGPLYLRKSDYGEIEMHPKDTLN